MSRAPWIVLSLLALAACDRDEPTGHEASLKRFESCDAMRDYAEDVVLETLLGSQYGDGWLWAVDEAASDDGGNGGDGPSDYTTTNVQEEGVDELDLVKTDGERIYVAQDQAVQILKSWPAEDAELLAQVELDGWARGLFLNGDELIVVEYYYEDNSGFLRSWAGTRVSWIDVSNPAAPAVTRTLDMDGYLADARMIGDETYLVINHYLYLPSEAWEILSDAQAAGELPELDWNLSGEEWEADRDAKRAEAREHLAPRVAEWASGLDVNDLIPSMREDGGEVVPMHDCTDIYRPAEVAPYNMLSVVHLDGDTGAVNPVGLMSDGWTVYASVDNLYVAQSSWWWWWGSLGDDLSTDVHKFELGAGGEPDYVASGTVPGWIYDQFALSEYDGYLRVATTDLNQWWGNAEDEEEPANNVFVLQDDGLGSLGQVGELRGIAPNEQIYAVRMMGDEGYVVTFEQIDPLFTLDLSDPTAPALVGELELPGYSAYLHPFGDDHLLAVGLAGDMDGNLGGLAINVFDVSDLANPQLAHQYVIDEQGWAWSEALYDHHAFTFHRGVLSIPAVSYDEGEYFSGLLVFSVDAEAGIEELGRIDHRGLVERSECLYASWYDERYQEQCYQDYWYASVRRSVYVEDKLFSISNYGALVNELYEPEVEVAEVLFYPRGE